MVESQEVERSTVVGQEENGKGHTIYSLHRQSDADVCAAVSEDYRTRPAWCSEAQSASIDEPTDGSSGGKGAASDVFENAENAMNRS